MLITIITVNKNSGKLFQKTSKSIISLLKKHKNISWLIIDSNSKDESFRSLKKILKYKKKLNLEAIIEEDDGIYNAMNKAIGIVKSKYLLFLNSGDTLNKKNFLAILKFLEFTNHSSIICGYKIYEKSNFFTKFIKLLIHKVEILLKFSLPTSHNSIIYLTNVVKQFPFNEEYICASDYDQYLNLLGNNHYFINKKYFKITNISNQGFVAKRKLTSYQECIKINFLRKHFFAFLYWKLKKLLLTFNLP